MSVKIMASGLAVPDNHPGQGNFGRRVADDALHAAAELRMRDGLTLSEISSRVRVSPATLSYYLGSIVREYPTMFERERRAAAERRALVCRVERDRRRQELLRTGDLRAFAKGPEREAARARRRLWRQWREKPQVISLDGPWTPHSSGYESIAGAALDPFDELFGDEVAEILGDLALEDISRLRPDELERLQRELRAVGVGPRSVQQRERSRLSGPERHRGAAPSPMRERKSSRHRGRKEQRALMAGKRTSRKARKRWERAA